MAGFGLKPPPKGSERCSQSRETERSDVSHDATCYIPPRTVPLL